MSKPDENAKFFPQLAETVPCQFIQLRDPYTLVELKMFSFVQAILSKKNWSQKLNDDTIREKWIQEAQVQRFEKSMIDYMLDRLQNEIKQTKNHGEIVSPFHAIFQSDNLIDENLKKKLLKEVEELEKKPKDFHPFSEDKVVNLIHPSLYCLVSDHSLISKTKQKQRDTSMLTWMDDAVPMKFPRVVIDPPEEFYQEYVEEIHPDYIAITKTEFISDKFQWLPSDISVSKEGKVKFQSYINNLNPLEHKSLYFTLENILEKFIPMFEYVLGYNTRKKILDYKYEYKLYEEHPFSSDYDEEDEDEDEKEPFFEEKFVQHKMDVYNLNGRDLQVIVKMANIELTPEKPNYEGGSWHMEGMENEKIISTGIYYYSSENITDSKLAFRQAVAQPEDSGQDYGQIFGYGFQSKLNQELGSIVSIEDRCIAFPNYYQHAVQKFKLKDSTKNGHRKILVFFLIDPNYDIISTSRVFPQQKEWITNAYGRLFQPILPKEVVDIIVEFSPASMSFEQAKKYRLELMDERKQIVQKQDGTVFARQCSLCEH